MKQHNRLEYIHYRDLVRSPEEREEERMNEERKDRFHQNYKRRRDNGEQKEYEDRIMAAMDAKKHPARRGHFKTRFIFVNTVLKTESKKMKQTA